MANTMGVNEELDQLYHINIQSDYPEYRLFVRGSAEPVVYEQDGFDLESWISLKSGFEPMKNYVYHLSDTSYTPFLKMTKRANAFTMLYIPQNQKCQQLRKDFLRLADAFHVPSLIAYHA